MDDRPHAPPKEIGTLVVGGGIVGSCIAGFLAEEGADVALIDDGRSNGSTTNAGSLHVQMQSRFMRLYPANIPGMERQLPLYVRAVTFWRTFEATIGADFDLKIAGGLMVAESAEQLDFLKAKAARERKAGLTVDVLDRAELDRIAPYFGAAVVGAEFCPNEGKVDPLLCNAAIRAWSLESGVVPIDGVTATRIERAGAGFIVHSSIGAIRAGRVVLAAAAGTAALAASIGVHIPARAEPLHMNVTEAADPLIGHLVQHADRMITLKQLGTGQVVIGGGWPATLGEPHEYPRVELSSLIGNAALALHVVPRLASLRILRSWAGINTSVDGRGVLGVVPGQPNLFIAIPGDAGYTLGPLSARMVADAVLGRSSSDDIGAFSPQRFKHTES